MHIRTLGETFAEDAWLKVISVQIMLKTVRVNEITYLSANKVESRALRQKGNEAKQNVSFSVTKTATVLLFYLEK